MTRPLPLIAAVAFLFSSASASARSVATSGAGARNAGPVVAVQPVAVLPAGGGVSVGSLSSPLGVSAAITAASPAGSAATVIPGAQVSGAAASAPSALPTAAAAVPAAVSGDAARRVTAGPAAAPASASALAEKPALAGLSAASVPEGAPARNDAAPEGRLDALFDGSVERAGSAAVDAAPAKAAAPLAPARKSGLRRIAAAAGLLFLAPTAAFAQSISAPAAAAGVDAMTLVTTYHPMATAIAAALGALFGLWAARGKDGSGANAGKLFASALSHGAIAGAAVFALVDLTKVVFLGLSASALAPLTAVIATAALAQAAFGPKFSEATTSSADRIMGAFPAVAAAFGLGLGAVALLSPVGLLALGAPMLAVTGAAAAIFAVLFKPETSAAGGPAAMGRGFVLQSLMTGLAFAVGDPLYSPLFFALGAWGFLTVLRTTAQEAWTTLPESFRKRFKRS